MIRKKGALRFSPAAEISHGGQRDILELVCIFGLGRRINGAVEVPADDILSLGSVEILQIGGGLLTGIVPIDIGIDYGDRRLCQDAQ